VRLGPSDFVAGKVGNLNWRHPDGCKEAQDGDQQIADLR
jgi:hypothetical protein